MGWANEAAFRASVAQHALPTGFEARWDPRTNRPFFVDHNSKKTTWKDPRGAVPATSPHGTTAAAKAAQEKRDKIQRISQSIQRKHRSAATAPDVVDGVVATVVGANPAASDFKAEVVAVRQLKTLGILTQKVPNPQAHKSKSSATTTTTTKPTTASTTTTTTTAAAAKSHGNTKPALDATQLTAIINRLDAKFPDAPHAVIMSVVNAAARESPQLSESSLEVTVTKTLQKSMGFKMRTTASASASHTTSSTAPSASAPTPPKPPQLSDRTKRELVHKLQKEHTSTPLDTVKMICESSGYNEEIARQLLGRTTESAFGAPTSTSSAASHAYTSRVIPTSYVSSTTTTATTGASSAPVAYVSASNPAQYHSQSTSQSATTSSSTVTAKPKQNTKPSQSKKKEQPAKQQQRTPVRQPQKHQPTRTAKAKAAPVKSSTRTYHSALATPTSGPDLSLRSTHSLARGTDSSLRTSSSSSALGPNLSLRSCSSLSCGPDKSLVSGPSLSSFRVAHTGSSLV